MVYVLSYQEQRSPLSNEEAKVRRSILRKVDVYLTGKLSHTKELFFLDERHMQVVLIYWNRQGDSMARKPCPITGKTMHWHYEPHGKPYDYEMMKNSIQVKNGFDRGV